MVAFAFGVVGFAFLFLGAWHKRTPLDEQWARQERWLLKRGQAPQRTSRWEATVASTSQLFLALGSLSMGVALIISVSQARRPAIMSGLTVNGYRLTQSEADSCNNDWRLCAMRFGRKGKSSSWNK